MRTIFLSLLFNLFSYVLTGQAYTNTVMVSGGIAGNGYGGELTYNNNLNESTFIQIALNVAVDNFTSGEINVPYSSFTASYSYFLTLFSTGRRMQVLSAGLGGLAGYELVNNGDNDLSNIVSVNGESRFIYGAQATAELDIIISERYSLVLKTVQFYHVNSDFGNLTNFSGVGIRYYFNK
ncbi:conjugal transfer protein TraO [Costertonia aggregata]|uniref:Conjugal transfer protein TraO n=1 Tax=Costertonia aggregata TaxID=343403 RepID=A0A7H9ATT3_9FLAO|nr:conjugal transfer protein TraO [Costertonia aggregata]QLG46864.1 conjugal transfer protein TraO [Costertonia aggregata]